jgi:hypothetical protein
VSDADAIDLTDEEWEERDRELAAYIAAQDKRRAELIEAGIVKLQVGQRVRIGPIRYNPETTPDDLIEVYKACEGRVLTIKDIEPLRDDQVPEGVPPFTYEFHIAHLTGHEKSNRRSYRESLYLDDTEVTPLKVRKKSKNAS